MRTALSLLLGIAMSAAASAAPAKLIRHSQGVPETYIVVLAEHVPAASVNGVTRSLAASYNVTVHTIWPDAPRGFLATGPEANFVAMSDDPRIKYVEQDAVLTPPTSRLSAVYAHFPSSSPRYWHLDRIDDPTWGERDYSYAMCPEAGDVTAYVIDRGVYIDHEEFVTASGHRVVQSLNFVRHEVPAGSAYPAVDTANGCVNDSYSGHGTAVASLLSGTNQGASRAKIVSLRVHSCGRNGSSLSSDVLNAIQWLAQRPPSTLGVVNWSGFAPPGDEQFEAIADAVRRMVLQTSMPFITAAGNFSTDACKFSPQKLGYNPQSRRTGEVLVVGASGIGANEIDVRWQETDQSGTPLKGESTGSNAGDCVGVYAPGHVVRIALNNGAANLPQYGDGTGTSYASPIAAGLAARYVSSYFAQYGVKPTHTQVYEFLTTNAYASVSRANTHIPRYWACFRPSDSGNYTTFTYDAHPGDCPGETDYGPYTFELPASPAPYEARMLYWDPTYNAPPGWLCEGEWLDW